MDVQLTEAAPECDVLIGRDVLVVEEQHQVIEQRLVNGLEAIVVERFPKVDAPDLGADSESLLRELGYDAAGIAAIRAAGDLFRDAFG